MVKLVTHFIEDSKILMFLQLKAGETENKITRCLIYWWILYLLML